MLCLHSMSDGYLIRYDELALKGKNRIEFEKQLIWNIRRKLEHFHPQIDRLWGRIWVRVSQSVTVEEALSQVFGISSFSAVQTCTSTVEEIFKISLEVMVGYFGGDSPRASHTQSDRAAVHNGDRENVHAGEVENKIPFRITTNRADKKFHLKSQQMNIELAKEILPHFKMLKVDLDYPELELGVEIHEAITFVYLKKQPGLAGLPVGTGGRVMTLLSGGIDSPVAAWLMMKRGCDVDFIHFFSYPYVGHESKEKVIDLVKKLSRFQNESRLYIIAFQKIQEAIHEKCHERFRTLLYRRSMQRIATSLANKEGSLALVTGESLGQVASQTLENLSTVSSVTEILILRPLICFNKQETIGLAKKIGTYDISIRPFDDCCTVFQPDSPATKSSANVLQWEEEKVSLSALVEEAIQSVETVFL